MTEHENDISVAIVEDDDEIRSLFELLIDRSPGFSCKLVFSNCESALEPIKKQLPDVVLMDIGLPGMNGIEGIRKLKESIPGTDFIMLTIREDEEAIFQSLCAGATGYLMKDTAPVRLLAAIQEVHEGGSPMSPGIARTITRSFQQQSLSVLTERETEILAKLCEGHNYNTIAQSLFISGHTVRAHIKNIYRKLHVSSRAEVVKKAMTNRLI
jgi:DNA-binding NarL/FixJ family response regulator